MRESFFPPPTSSEKKKKKAKAKVKQRYLFFLLTALATLSGWSPKIGIPATGTPWYAAS